MHLIVADEAMAAALLAIDQVAMRTQTS